MYNDNILFQALRLIKSIFRILFMIFITLMVALFNDFGWTVGIGCNGYMGRKMDVEKLWNEKDYTETVAFGSLTTVNGGVYVIKQQGPVLHEVDLCGGNPMKIGGTSRTGEFLNSHLDNNFYTRSKTSLDRKQSRMNQAIITASVAAIRLRVVIARLKANKNVGTHDGDGQYCGGYDQSKDHRFDTNSDYTEDGKYYLTDAATTQVVLNHAPSVVVGHGAACLVEYEKDHFCGAKVNVYSDLFSVSLPPEQEAAEAAMLQMGTEDFWLTAAHENGVHNDAAIRESVKAFHRILNERHPHFDEGGVQDTRSATFMQIIGLQNFQ